MKSKLAKDLNKSDWRKLAGAFYCLAHNDFKQFESLEDQLKNTDVGQICQEYIQTGNSELVDRAGRLLAGAQWYVALGR